jgi:hypothetical protein
MCPYAIICLPIMKFSPIVDHTRAMYTRSYKFHVGSWIFLKKKHKKLDIVNVF